MTLFSAVSSLTYHFAPFGLNVTTTSLLCIPPLMVFPKALFSALYSSSCTLPLSVPSSLNHHLYADNTHLFFTLHPLNFDSRIFHLQNAFQQIPSWMTANLLTLNTFKTELLLTVLSRLIQAS